MPIKTRVGFQFILKSKLFFSKFYSKKQETFNFEIL